jgi:dTDP-4-amino-4,6-dideoxy-D-galactose acyltransferase
MITKLDWDTKFFGYPVGKAVFNDIDNFKMEDFLNESADYKLVYIFSPSLLSISKVLHADSKVLLIKSLKKNNTDFQGFSYCESYKAGIHDYQQLELLAIESGTHSRFKIDPNFINDEFEKLYKKWISNSVLKNFALETLIMREENKIVGLITIGRKKANIAEISLVAVCPGHQGKGIGSKLIRDAETYALNEGFDKLQVVTQQLNVNAMKLYQKNGFEIEQIINVYHYWNL